MKINLDEQGYSLLKDNFDEPESEIVEPKTVYNPKTPAWKRRADKKINERQKRDGKLTVSVELTVLAKWFLPPLVVVTAGTELEQSGHDLRGIAWLGFVVTLIAGWWLYLKLLENPNQLWGVLWRGGLFAAGLFLGVVYGAS